MPNSQAIQLEWHRKNAEKWIVSCYAQKLQNENDPVWRRIFIACKKGASDVKNWRLEGRVWIHTSDWFEESIKIFGSEEKALKEFWNV